MHQTMPAKTFRVVIVSFLLPWAVAQCDAQDGDTQEMRKEFDLDYELDRLSDLTLVLPKPDAEGFTPHNYFDVDGDGVNDLEVRTKSGRGPLSTYYTVYRLVAVNGAKFLKGGVPNEAGTAIEIGDLFSTVDSINLCSVGGSLRYPERSFEDFSNGTWWGIEQKGLALMLVNDDQIRVGFSKMTVTKKGVVTVDDFVGTEMQFEKPVFKDPNEKKPAESQEKLPRLE